MSGFTKQAEEIKQEQKALRSMFDSLASEIDRLRTAFFSIERKCFAGDNHHCISVHDNFKLEIAQVQRLEDREKMLCYENCTPIIPSSMIPRDVDNWELRSREEYEVFRKYFDCFKPYMQNYIQYMQQERAIFERANKQMSELVHH